MTIIELLELLEQWTDEMTTAKNVRHKLKEASPSLETMIELEKAMAAQRYTPPRGRPQPPVQEEAPAEVENKIHQIFEQGMTPALSKEYFHIENRLGKHCWEARQQREAEQGIVYTDKGSPPFAAQRKSLCNECGQAIEPGDGTILRSRERGVA